MPGICSEVQSPKIDENMVKANDQKQKENTITFSRERYRTLGFKRGRLVVQLWQWRTADCVLLFLWMAIVWPSVSVSVVCNGSIFDFSSLLRPTGRSGFSGASLIGS